jgi:hypothetical protein
MSGSPDPEFAKIFELLNAFEQLDDNEQPASSTISTKQTLPKPPTRPSIVPEAENSLAAHVAAAMAKRRHP